MNITNPTQPTIDHQITVEVLKLAKDFPRLGLSFGYIGCFSGRAPDNRGWRVFTKQTDERGSSVCWGDFDTDKLADMYAGIQAGMLREFCNRLAVEKVS